MAAQEVHHSGVRRTVATLLVVIASILALLGLFALWLNRQALNTDNWTRTSSELLEQPQIRSQIAARLTDQLFASVDVQAALADVLPPRAEVLAGPAANALRTQVDKIANRALERPDVQQLWADANRAAHIQLLAVLNGGGDTVSTENGRVVLNLSRVLDRLQSQVGIGGRLRKVLPASATEITIFQARQLKTAQNVVKVLKPLPWILLLSSFGLVAIAMLIAPHWRRKALRAYGIGFVLAGLAALLIRSVAGDEFVRSLAKTAAAEPSVALVWSISTDLLVDAATATIVYGVLMIVGAWLAGPTSWARAVRGALTPYWREPAIAYGGLVLVLAIVVWWAPTPAWRNVAAVLILAGLLAIGVEALRRQMIREFPDATLDEAKQRHRERWEGVLAAGRRRGESLRGAASRGAQSASGAIAGARDAAVSKFAGAEDERLDQLERLVKLRDAGILDDAELRAEKARILAGDSDGVATT